jgi:hypothetical protein
MHDEQDRVRTEPVEEEEEEESSGRSVVQAGAGARYSKSLEYNLETLPVWEDNLDVCSKGYEFCC